MKKTRTLHMIIGLFIALAIVAVTPAVRAADGATVYTDNCAKCHGVEGKGDTKMGVKLGCKDLSDPKVQDVLEEDAAIKAIKEGVKDGDKTKMKAFDDISDAEAKAVVAYIRTLKK
jgi:mono/diheme cytochrome c family protein